MELPQSPAPPRSGIWKRYLIGSIVVVAASCAVTAGFAFTEIAQITASLHQNPRLELGASLTPAQAGGPQTLLLIGSDKRPRAKSTDRLSPPHSDTLMLVRLDPNQPATTMLSIPRDLKVRIGSGPKQKINSAYAIGGPRLTVETVRRVMGLNINHVVDINFRGFKDAVDAVGCVYADVDRRYFNDNSTAAYGQGYATININPGYQRLCGQDALDYVRYRHTDTDIVRAARQQDFLRQAKQQLGLGTLFSQRATLEKIFGRYTQTDVRSQKQVFGLLNLAAFSSGRPVQRIPFPAQLGPSFVYASAADIRSTVYEFLHGGRSKGGGAAQPPAGGGGGPGARAGRRHRNGGGRPSASGLAFATAADIAGAHSMAAGTRFPALFPRREVQVFPGADSFRAYYIRAIGGRLERAYRVVVPVGLSGEYYGIQGTTWRDPPILAQPSESRRVGGRKLDLYWDGSRLRFVAWHTRRAAYWISNTLTNRLTNAQMLTLAATARPA